MLYLHCPLCRQNIPSAAEPVADECGACGAPLVITPRPLPPAPTFEVAVGRLLEELSWEHRATVGEGKDRRGADGGRLTGLDVVGYVTGGAARLELRGVLDAATCLRAEQALRALERKQPKELLLDLRELTFINSAGLTVVLEADQRAVSRGTRLRLAPGGPAVQRPFEVTGLDSRLEWVVNLSEFAAQPSTGVGPQRQTVRQGEPVPAGGSARARI